MGLGGYLLLEDSPLLQVRDASPSLSWGPGFDSESCEHEHFSLLHLGLLFIHLLYSN